MSQVLWTTWLSAMLLLLSNPFATAQGHKTSLSLNKSKELHLSNSAQFRSKLQAVSVVPETPPDNFLGVPAALMSLSLKVSLPAALVSSLFLLNSAIFFNADYKAKWALAVAAVSFSSVGLLWESLISILYWGSDLGGPWLLLSMPMLLVHLTSVTLAAITIHRLKTGTSQNKVSETVKKELKGKRLLKVGL